MCPVTSICISITLHSQFEHDKRVGGLASQMSDTVRHVIHTGHFRIIVVINIV